MITYNLCARPSQGSQALIEVARPHQGAQATRGSWATSQYVHKIKVSGVLEVGHSCCHKRNRLFSSSILILSCQDYHKLFSSVTYKDESSGRDFCFEFVFSGNCQTYVVAKGNPCQVYWMWRKRETGDWTSPRTLDIQKLLDTSVYSEECLSVYESVIGDGFVTPGGLSATKVSGRGEGKGRGGLLRAFAAVVMFIDFLLLWGKVR